MSDRSPDGSTVHVVVPDGIDDGRRPSGGNVYDRRLCEGLRDAGWTVYEHRARGRWPRPGQRDQTAFRRLLAGVPDRATTLVDGLVGSASAATAAESGRLRLVVLVHMPLAEAAPDEDVRGVERAALSSAEAVVTTSRWARSWVVEHHGLDPDRVHVAVPGADRGSCVTGSDAGGRLLCVGPVTPDKGHDVLLDALIELQDLEWQCTCPGALDLDPAFVDRVAERAVRAGIADRVSFPGPLSGAQLDAIRSETDLAVSASRRESFGMAVAEGLARGIPVVATTAGGHPESVGRADDGSRPGLLVPVGDAGRLAAALRRWLTDPAVRAGLRRSAARRRARLATWAETTRAVSDVLRRVDAVNPAPLGAVSPSNRHRTDG